MTSRFFSFFLLCFSFCLSPFAFSQPLPDRKPLVGLSLDSAGKPIAGAIISIRRQDDSGSYAFWGASVATDARGEFRFSQAELGRYYLNAEVAGFAPIYNQVVMWKGDGPLRLQFDRLVNFRPQILRPNGSPVSNSIVWLRLRGDGNAGQTTRRLAADASGQIAVESLLPANYSLFLASGEGFAVGKRLELRSNLAPQIRLQKGGAIRAIVRGAGAGSPFLGGALMALVPETPQEAVRLLGENADPGDDFASLGAMGDRVSLVSRDGDGLIEVPNLPPGRYMANFTLSGYETSAPQKVEIKASETFDLSPVLAPKSSAKARLTLQLRPADGAATTLAGTQWTLRLLSITLNGTLLGDNSPDDTPFSSDGAPGRRVLADGDGKLTLFPLSTGHYRVFVARRVPGEEAETGESASLDVNLVAGDTTASLEIKALQK